MINHTRVSSKSNTVVHYTDEYTTPASILFTCMYNCLHTDKLCGNVNNLTANMNRDEYAEPQP